MKRRIKMALPLVFAFVLTLLPFGLLEYNQHQRSLIRHERELLKWEHKAGNYLQMFKSLWSMELQIRYRLYKMKQARQSQGLDRNFSGSQFQADLRGVFPQKLLPVAVYAGIYEGGKGVRMLTGEGFYAQKQRFFKRILEALASPASFKDEEVNSLNGLVRGAFGEVIDFNLLKNFRRGKVSRVMFEGTLRLACWDVIEASDGSRLVFIQLFSPGELDRLAIMKLVANRLSTQNPDICSVLMPLEFSDKSRRPVFDDHVPPEQRQRILGLFERINAKPLERDYVVPAGKFVNYQGVRVFRDFIDYAVPYEVWVLSRDNPEINLREPAVSFLLRLFFFAAWILVFCKVIISGHPVGVSLKDWLTLTFIVVGILPLAVFFVAGIFQIDSTLFRNEQEAIKDALQRLEEADASGEVILSDFREACRRWTREKEWVENISAWNTSAWEKAVKHIQKRFITAGLNIGAAYIYPPDRSGIKDRLFVMPGPGNKPVEEEQTRLFYQSWIRKSYFLLAPELMTGPEPEMSMFHGRTGREILRVFLSNRGDVEFVDLGDEKQMIYQNFILQDGKPRNWYFFRFDVDRIFENHLLETVKSLQEIYSENFYGIIFLDGIETRMAFPRPGSKAAMLVKHVAGKMIDLGSVTRSQLIEHTDDKLVITYPCAKSGASILVNIVYFTTMRAAAFRQEVVLALVVLLMTIPVIIISRLTAGYLVAPLAGVENGLKKIADEDYSEKLHLQREDELGVLTRAFDQMVEGLKERRNLGRFVSATLDQQVSRTESEENSGLESRIGAVLCSDIRSFTGISEANDVREVVAMLNDHLAAMSECIHSCGGLIEQFVGDAVLAVFHGLTLEEASQKAVTAATAMMQRHREICRQRQEQGRFAYAIGIGIEAGQLLSGSVSAGLRREYTVVGVARNAAEDLESRSRNGRFTKILVSPQVFQLVDNYEFVLHVDEENFELVELEGKA